MSVSVQGHVWALPLEPMQKLVALALADHAHDDGTEAWPSKQTIATKTGLSVRQIQRLLAQLVDAGVIIVDRPAAQHRPTTYRFPLHVETARRDTRAPLASVPGVTSVLQGRHPRPPGETQLRHPNHQEPSIEKSDSSNSDPVDMDWVRRGNDQTLPGLAALRSQRKSTTKRTR